MCASAWALISLFKENITTTGNISTYTSPQENLGVRGQTALRARGRQSSHTDRNLIAPNQRESGTVQPLK